MDEDINAVSRMGEVFVLDVVRDKSVNFGHAVQSAVLLFQYRPFKYSATRYLKSYL